MKRYFSLLMLVALCGCATMEDTKDYALETWNTTRNYLDPAPEIDTTETGMSDPNQIRLAELFVPVDDPLTNLARYLSTVDTRPDQEWMDLVMARYPWAHRIIVTDADGNMLAQSPSVPVKRISQPLHFEAVWRETFIKSVVDYPALGPEMYLGTPYYEGTDFKGLIIVGFDPRTLMAKSPEPKNLVLIHPGNGVWTKGAVVDKAGMLELPWEEMLMDDVFGKFELNGTQYTWLARYVGKHFYVYATESVDPMYEEESSWWPF